MRCYLQGTLDYSCGIYAVINALSCTHGIDLGAARAILQEAFHSLPGNPFLWRAFTHNETDHYWLIRRSLSRWCLGPHWLYRAEQPFSDCLMPGPQWIALDAHAPYLPEATPPRGPVDGENARREASAAWAVLQHWFEGQTDKLSRTDRVALLRFHRFLPGMPQPIISHWTAARSMVHGTLMLQDASPEARAIRSISEADCSSDPCSLPMIRIVPESILLLERQNRHSVLHMGENDL